MKPIILIGYMGSGKTTIGKLLAQRSGFQFYDTDAMIEEQEQETIKHIFSTKGELYFRKLETKLLESLQEERAMMILSTGGGMPCMKENATLLHQLGTVVFLKVSKETVIKRLKNDTTRPLLQGEGFEEKIGNMLQLRDPIYASVADLVVEVDDLAVDEVVDVILGNKLPNDETIESL